MKNKSNALILSLDCGTTGNRAIIFDRRLRTVASSYREFTQHYPKPGWVEHDALEIWQSTRRVLREALQKVNAKRIVSMGITNQRETIVLWDKKSGRPVHRAIVWQCRRTADDCLRLKKKGMESGIHRKTGLFLDPYFSGTKIKWLSDRYPKIKKGLKTGRILCGTIDSWIIWKLSGGKVFSTDPTNASRTLLFDIKKASWDKSLCNMFDVPIRALPQVNPSCGIHGYSDSKITGRSIPIAGVAGDQQSAAFAQGCSPKGIVKNTYGTGLFVVADTGKKIKISNRLVTTVAASDARETRYALEGSIFIGGAAMQWLRDGLKIIAKASHSEKIAQNMKSNDGVYFVPALVGLGCPHWDPNARGVVVGITRQTTDRHLIRAAVESMAFQTRDVVDLFRKEARIPIRELRVDGGAVKNNFLMQFQADILGCKVERPKVTETTALGAAALAGIAVGVWTNQADFLKSMKVEKIFKPKMNKTLANQYYREWQKALERSKDWT